MIGSSALNPFNRSPGPNLTGCDRTVDRSSPGKIMALFDVSVLGVSSISNFPPMTATNRTLAT